MQRSEIVKLGAIDETKESQESRHSVGEHEAKGSV
jgi:hypothetical protein